MTDAGHRAGRLVVVHPLRPGGGARAQPERLGRPARLDRDAQGLSRPRPPAGSRSAKADELLILPGIARDEDGHPHRRQGAPEHPDRRARERDHDQHHRSRRSAGVAEAAARLQDRRRQGLRRRAGASASSAGQMSARFKGAQVGGRLDFGPKEIYNVVGIFTAGGSAAESEVWADLKDVEKNTGRDGSVSCVQLRAASAARLRQAPSRRSTTTFASSWRRSPNRVYFETQSRSGIFLKGAGTLIAVLLTFGAMFSSANTMFAAVSARTREIGTMRALGFSQFDILISFLGESLLLCALGGAVGLAGDAAAQRADLRNQRLQQLRLDHRLVPLRPAGHGRRPADDPRHGPLRRHVPRACGRCGWM